MELRAPTKEALEVVDPATGQRTVVSAGQSVEATGDHAKSLLAQGWIRTDKPKTRAETTTDKKDGE